MINQVVNTLFQILQDSYTKPKPIAFENLPRDLNLIIIPEISTRRRKVQELATFGFPRRPIDMSQNTRNAILNSHGGGFHPCTCSCTIALYEIRFKVSPMILWEMRECTDHICGNPSRVDSCCDDVVFGMLIVDEFGNEIYSSFRCTTTKGSV